MGSIILRTLAAGFFAFSVSGCSSSLSQQSTLGVAEITQDPVSAELLQGQQLQLFYDDLSSFNEELWIKGNWSNPRPPFDTSWSPDSIVFNDGQLNLILHTNDCPAECDGRATVGGEYRTRRDFGFGYYVVRMKPAGGSGLNSSFFMYSNDTSDEIDIEFLGRNCRAVQFNYYNLGVGGHEYLHELPFDACDEYHDYAFRWEPDSITWYVDGEEVYQVRAVELPSNPGHIMMNLWAGYNEDPYTRAWLGEFADPGAPVRAFYDEVWFNPR